MLILDLSKAMAHPSAAIAVLALIRTTSLLAGETIRRHAGEPPPGASP